MDKFHRAGRVGGSVLRGQATDKRDDICLGDRGMAGVPFVSQRVIWPGMASGRCPVVLCFPSCQKLLNQENALGAPCLRCDFCSPPAPTRSAGMLRTGIAFDVTLAVAITEALRRQALMLIPVVGGICTGRVRRCKAKQGRREDGADVRIPTYTVVRFLGRVKRLSGRRLFGNQARCVTSSLRSGVIADFAGEIEGQHTHCDRFGEIVSPCLLPCLLISF
jgi:hypothetical protein